MPDGKAEIAGKSHPRCAECRLEGIAIGDIGWCKDPFTTPSTMRYARKGDTSFHHFDPVDGVKQIRCQLDHELIKVLVIQRQSVE